MPQPDTPKILAPSDALPGACADTVRCSYQSPLGSMTLRATADALSGVWFDGQKHQPDPSQWRHADGHPVLLLCATQLDEYFAGRRTQFELPLDLDGGTPFQRLVWHSLLEIGWGQTRSYGQLAVQLGRAGAARAIGSAVGRNPLSIVVPCHRVLGGQGSLTGYAGGLARKQALLRLEQTA